MRWLTTQQERNDSRRPIRSRSQGRIIDTKHLDQKFYLLFMISSCSEARCNSAKDKESTFRSLSQ